MSNIDLNTLLSVNWKRLIIIVEFVRRKRRRSDVLTEIENIIDFVSSYNNLCLFLHCLKYIQYCKMLVTIKFLILFSDKVSVKDYIVKKFRSYYGRKYTFLINKILKYFEGTLYWNFWTIVHQKSTSLRQKMGIGNLVDHIPKICVINVTNPLKEKER